MSGLHQARGGRIAFVLSNLRFGGAERVALTLASALQRNGYAIDFLLMQHEGEFLSDAQGQFRVIDLQCDRTWKLPLRLMAYLRRERPSALISSFWKLNLCACLARMCAPGTKLALWEHSPPSKSSNSPVWLYGATASLLYRLSTAVVAVSSGVARDILSNTAGLGSRVRVIWNPIPGPRQTGDAPTSAEDRRSIVWVGRLDGPKNPGLMLEAFSRLPPGAYQLQFVGDGPLRQRLEAEARRLGLDEEVRFLGFQPDPYAIMTRASLLVLTSHREGFGNVLVEALHAGLRAVSTDCGAGVHDILGSSYGSIVPCSDPEALASAIERELQAPYDPVQQRLGARRFDPDAIGREFLRALRLGDAPTECSGPVPGPIHSLAPRHKSQEAPPWKD